MDPFIEGYNWSHFHVSLFVRIADQLTVQLPRHYSLYVEMGVSANEMIFGKSNKSYRPDVSIIETDPRAAYVRSGASTAVVTPPAVTIPLEDVESRTIAIRNAHNQELITAIEVLSPKNKQGEGLSAYRFKRNEFIRNQVNLVEIDLLRMGRSPYPTDRFPLSTYRLQSTNSILRAVEFWTSNLDESLPTISIPLLEEDYALTLNLQDAFEQVYKHSTFWRDIEYTLSKLKPAANPEESETIARILAQEK